MQDIDSTCIFFVYALSLLSVIQECSVEQMGLVTMLLVLLIQLMLKFLVALFALYKVDDVVSS